ncbi:uncharacterized protein LOC127721789 [Mytilus californianus]|uniref:uncharacterized protein LOC127721789 n=1 Tax=Mytilus californianus TaxID=6549 RepID=UPI002247C639|nr:uncharacterized protein LOC127721789 [Mytilus californianus]
MRLIRLIGCVILMCMIDAAPSGSIDSNKQTGPKIYEESFFYSLFLKLMSNGSLRQWINQKFLRPSGSSSSLSFGANGSNNRQTTTIQTDTTSPSLTFVRDHDPNVKVQTSTSAVKDLTVERDHMNPTPPSGQLVTDSKTTKNKDKFTIPIVILTGTEAEKIKVPDHTTESLTVVRDYMQDGSTKVKRHVSRRKRAHQYQLPMVRLSSKIKYNNPSDQASQTAPLTDDDGQDLVIVRDKSNQPKTVTFKFVPCGNGQMCIVFA